jgi:hypothetical protein
MGGILCWRQTGCLVFAMRWPAKVLQQGVLLLLSLRQAAE